MKLHLALLSLITSFGAITALQPFAGAAQVAPQDAADERPLPPKLDEALYDHYGAGVREGATWIAVETVLVEPAKHVGQSIRLRGPITSVCQKKGCWMHLGSEEQPVLVKFKDYAFFVPKDASGRTAILDGVLSFKQETVEETRHYLEDAGKHEEAKRVTEGRKIHTFLATGVALRKAAKPLDEERYDFFGERLLEGPWTSVDAVLAAPAQHLDRTVRLSGTISSVCQVKGCWMHLGSEQQPVMVKFKDYAFFVPKAAAGRIAFVEGTLTLRQETVEQTRHYLEDAGKHEEAKRITEGRKIYFFMAHGAALAKPQG